jgi:four helix bundle protein
MIKSYRDLFVWQKSFGLVKDVYKITGSFPKSELFGLVNQMRRAAVAIPSNIAEGFSRKSRKEYAQFIMVAFASGAELETQLLLAESLSFVSEEDVKNLLAVLTEIMKMLNALSAKLRI